MINRVEVHEKYMEKVMAIIEECDWKTHFEPKEIVHMICSIIEQDYKVEPKATS